MESNFRQLKRLAVITSGGGSPGMNAVLQTVVRMGIHLGCEVFIINNGYQGMIEGDACIFEADWSSVSSIIRDEDEESSVIGSTKCMDFMEKSNRKEATKNLIQQGITNLVVIGGDGSLTGANIFRQEWACHVEDLYKAGEITEEQYKKSDNLFISGVVCSINNDFCGTNMAIGTDSALHHIQEAVDYMVLNSFSHRQTFIFEVMGGHCGYLALASALAYEADYVFIPEMPPPTDWPEKLSRKLKQKCIAGERLNIIIVSEGAIDREGRAITADMVKKVALDRDTKVTVLGDVQRSGSSSVFDRVLGCRLGVEAVKALMEATPETNACVISSSDHQAVRLNLSDCVNDTNAVAKAMADKNWDLAVQLRGRSFVHNLEIYKILNKWKPSQENNQGCGPCGSGVQNFDEENEYLTDEEEMEMNNYTGEGRDITWDAKERAEVNRVKNMANMGDSDSDSGL